MYYQYFSAWRDVDVFRKFSAFASVAGMEVCLCLGYQGRSCVVLELPLADASFGAAAFGRMKKQLISSERGGEAAGST
jgi:hypothetical protein